MNIQIVAKSDIGMVRKYNEDYCGVFEKENLVILCDGMGGHKAGAEASRLAVSTIRYMYIFLEQELQKKLMEKLEPPYYEIAAPLISSIRLANLHIYNKAKKNPQLQGMGTTVSALAIIDGVACLAHVGDSRIYRIRDNKMELLTEDHSWINELIQDNEIKREEASQFEKKNVITRALGLAPSVKIDLKIEPVQEGDIFLLCSDGLTTSIADEEIQRIVSYNMPNLDHAIIHLIDSANMANGSDNTTVSLVRTTDLAPDYEEIKPLSVTIKAENEETSMIENRILKQEFYRENFPKNLSSMLKNNYLKISAAAILPIMAILLFKISFSNQNIKHTVENEIVEMSQNIEENSVLGKNKSEVLKEGNKKVIAHPGNKTDQNVQKTKPTVEGEQLRTRSLNKVVGNRGQIYLVGLEKLVNINETFLFLDNQLLGKTIEFSEVGIRVRPGKHALAIKDTNNKVIFQQDNVWISTGDVKAIEYKPVSY